MILNINLNIYSINVTTIARKCIKQHLGKMSIISTATGWINFYCMTEGDVLLLPVAFFLYTKRGQFEFFTNCILIFAGEREIVSKCQKVQARLEERGRAVSLLKTIYPLNMVRNLLLSF